MRDRVRRRGIDMELTPEAVDFLIETGYNPDFGAHPLRRAIEQHIENPLSEQVLEGKFKGIAALRITVGNGELLFTATKTKEEPEPKDDEKAEAGAESASQG